MLALSFSAASGFVVTPAVRIVASTNPLSPVCRSDVVLREVTFAASLTVETEPFKEGSKPLGEWFRQPEALSLLMSTAERCRRIDSGDSTAATQKWEVTTPIQFPGMVARSETPMDIAVDSAAPRLSVSSGESKTVCEGGPGWAQALLARISDIATTSSSNVIEVRNAPDGSLRLRSQVKLTVKLSIPSLLLPPFVPAGPFEKSGSESIQKLLEKGDMAVAPTLAKYVAEYSRWAS